MYKSINQSIYTTFASAGTTILFYHKLFKM